MEKFDTYEGSRGLRAYLFTGLVLVSQVLGLMAIILVAVWMGHFHGGFAWQQQPSIQFNYHPLFMIIGMVFLYGDAILVYRVFRNDRKIYVKVLHAVLHVLALIFASVGLKAVFDSHNLNEPPIPNLYSLHSWIGLITVLLFCIQWVCGFVSFLVPGMALGLRATYLPVHVFAGLVIFIMAIASCLMGITEKAIWSVPDYKNHVVGREGAMVNCLGLVLVALGILIVYLITNPSYARQPLPEEQHLQLDE